jgi:hypothetical protein
VTLRVLIEMKHTNARKTKTVKLTKTLNFYGIIIQGWRKKWGIRKFFRGNARGYAVPTCFSKSGFGGENFKSF